MTGKEIKAPYMSKGWMVKFLSLVKRVRLTKINSKVIAQHNITTAPNAARMVSGLRFLNIIDAEGNVVNENFNKLRLEGAEYKNALKEMIEKAYSELINTVEIDKAMEEDILNYFIGKYGYSTPQAKQATVLFSYLCGQAEIPISPELERLNKIKHLTKKRIPKKEKDNLNIRIPVKKQFIQSPSVSGAYVASIQGPGLTSVVELNEDLAFELKDKLDELAKKKRTNKSES